MAASKSLGSLKSKKAAIFLPLSSIVHLVFCRMGCAATKPLDDEDYLPSGSNERKFLGIIIVSESPFVCSQISNG